MFFKKHRKREIRLVTSAGRNYFYLQGAIVSLMKVPWFSFLCRTLLFFWSEIFPTMLKHQKTIKNICKHPKLHRQPNACCQIRNLPVNVFGHKDPLELAESNAIINLSLSFLPERTWTKKQLSALMEAFFPLMAEGGLRPRLFTLFPAAFPC